MRRVLPANRADAVAGSEFTFSDIGGFSDPLGLWQLKIVDRRPMLVHVSGATMPPASAMPELHAGFFPMAGRPVAMREACVIEATPRIDTIYGRKLLLIDAEVFRLADATFYDRQGELLKGVEQFWRGTPEGHPYPAWTVIFNFQTGGATLVANHGLAVNVGPPLRLFQTSAMKEFSR